MRNLLVLAAVVALASPLAAQTTSDSYSFIKAVRDRDINKAQSLLGARGSVALNARDTSTGETALHIVVKRRDTAWTNFLLQRGADAQAQDRGGDTPLGAAARLGFLDGAKLILAHGVKPDAANSRGETPLILAVQNRKLEMVQLLLRLGANPNKADSVAGYSALDYAKRDRRSVAILRALETRPAAKR